MADSSHIRIAAHPTSLRVLAVDYDGTLTDGGPPTARVQAALREARERGLTLVLVTGRMLDDLRAELVGVDDAFDAIVAENGAVLSIGGDARALAPQVDTALEQQLRARGVLLRRGQVILAGWSEAAGEVHAAIARLGLDAQVLRNREALMVLPSGVSKGSGLRAALDVLRLSPHAAVGVGDAENDHALLEACEVGVAVGNAVSSLKIRADLVLRGHAGDGVIELLRGTPFVGPPLRSSRWRLALGTFDDDESSATIPASQVRVVVHGPSGAGKSFLAGLMAEQLILGGYDVCLVDAEGDYLPLADLPGVVLLGGGAGASVTPTDVTRYVRDRFGAVVVDLSHLGVEERRQRRDLLLPELVALREELGRPQWLFIDEAHDPCDDDGAAWRRLIDGPRELVLVTWRPQALPAAIIDDADIVVRVLPGEPHRAVIDKAPGQTSPRVFTVGRRRVCHVRHWHKYLHSLLPPHHRFRFLDGAVVGEAANIDDFVRQLGGVRSDVVSHHVGNGDFSRWLGDVLQDHELANDVRVVERAGGAPEAVRAAIIDVIRRRYIDQCPAMATAAAS